VKAAAAMNEKYLAGSTLAAAEIHRLTDFYNGQLVGGKWRGMMSDNPRGQLAMGVLKNPAVEIEMTDATNQDPTALYYPGADFVESNFRVVMEAAHASAFVPGQGAYWQRISGLGYNGEAVSIYPTTTAVRASPESIRNESPCLAFKIAFQTPGDWEFVVRALPTFSVDAGKPQRYAVALDDEIPRIISLPLSQDERNHVWQQNVLRNAALGSSTHRISVAGLHTLKIWMVDPGIVLDAIEAETARASPPGYVWPLETK
jgi:hypothetical protein